MIRMEYSVKLDYLIAHQPSDFIFNIHAAQTDHQTVVEESLILDPQLKPVIVPDPTYGARFMRLRTGPGPLSVSYRAVVNIDHHMDQPGNISEVSIAELPPSVLPFIYPSRYCQSDVLRRLATAEFGDLPQGYSRVKAIESWVRNKITFTLGVSDSSTSCLDTLLQRVGVCREFAHLMIALCRALNIPARFVTGIDYGADPAMGPTDFHAYVEVFLGNRWYLFDPSGISPPMGLVRIGTGRDAADAAFATMFGSVTSTGMPVVTIDAICDPQLGMEEPRHCEHAVSSMAVV